MAKEKLITPEQAKQEIDKWLDFVGFDTDEIDESSEASIKKISQRICDGSLVINEDMTMTYQLAEPIGSDGKQIKELKINNRVTRRMVLPHLENVNAKNSDMRILAYLAALTGLPSKMLLADINNKDQKILDSIVVFFVA